MRRLSLLLACLPAIASADLAYKLTPDLPAKSIRVALTLEEADSQVEMRIPAWCPGFYFLLNYQDKISGVKATDAKGKALTVTKKDPRGWLVANPSKGPVTFSYSVLGDDGGLGFFGVSVKPHTVFVNGPAGFMYPVGRLEEPVTLKLNLPKDWKVGTGMSPGADGQLVAGGYDEFIDHPLQLGIFESRKFIVAGIPFEAVYVSPDQTYKADLDQETDRLRKLSAPAIKLFKGAPFKRYVYIVHLSTGNFGGGLEHRASTVLAVSNTRPLNIDTLATHEFFHTCNVKQIRPKVLGPFDYTKEVRTRNLWFAEGVTDYYAQMNAYQSGLMSEEELFRVLADEIRSLQSSKVRLERTLEQVCLDAWENGGFGVGDLSYYNKGAVAGFVFDAAIRTATNGEKSLDDVMRLLYARHRLPNPGYEENGLMLAINEVAGTDLTKLYQQVVQSTEEVPYDVLLGIGLKVSTGARNGRTLVRDTTASNEVKARLEGWLKR